MYETSLEPSMLALMESSHDRWSVKAVDSAYLYGNPCTAHLCGYADQQALLGDTDYELPCAAVKSAPLFLQQDREVIERHQPLRALDIQPYANGEWHVFISDKIPLLDAQLQVSGVISHGVDITSRRSLALSYLLGGLTRQDRRAIRPRIGANSYFIDQRRGQVDLSRQETDSLFLLLHGRSHKQIARVLNLTRRSVADQLANLKRKFEANSQADLLESAIQAGYLNQIPPSLFNRQLSLILSEQE